MMVSMKDIPRYEILATLGEGALASVYKVRTLKDGSIRALKALKPEQAGTERAVARFEDEYRILSALHHPTLPEVYDYGTAPGGTPFMVMEYLAGNPLDEYVRENPSDLWLLLYQLNESLAFIHEHNLLHLDLKPSNVLVRRTKALGNDEMPLAVLIDFGLSYRRETGGKVKLVGTPGYMAPEVIRGEENLTRAVDYYSLGVILYELIEGRLPFRGSMPDILRAHLAEAVTFERRKVEYAELYPWIEKLMSKEPRERLEAFQEFRRAMAARLGETTEKIERVFALGYVESLGLVGKKEAWDELTAWASRLSEGLAARRKEVERSRGSEETGAPKETASPDVLKGSATGLEERIKQDLMASAAAARGREHREEPIRGIPRVLAITGPPQSGKSHILSALKTELHVRGVNVVSLGNESDYEAMVSGGGVGEGVGLGKLVAGARAGVGRSVAGRRARSEAVDPGSIVIDRFVAVWEQLSQMGKGEGVVVIVDDLERARVEEKEFLEYIGKRLGHEVAEGKEPGVFVIAVGRSADAKRTLLPVAGKERALSALEVPPPGREDAEAIAERFRGHLSGVTEQRSLATFLQANLHTSASLHASLKQAIADGCLVHQHGRWRFHDRMVPRVERADSSSAYYQGLFRELKGAARELVAVLACHPSALSSNEIADISGLSEIEIDEAIETIRPYRIIELVVTQQGRRIDIISDQVREGLRLALKKKERDRIHKRTIAHFAGRVQNTPVYFEILSQHYEQLGLAREALLMRVRALAAARKDQDVFALRRLCERGIEYVRHLRSREWRVRRWLIERYFIKQWVDAEWMVTNNGNLVRVVEDHFARRKREVPLSFLYKYATALERTGNIDACKKVLEDGKRRVKDKKSETYYLLVLEEGNVLYLGQQLADSLRCLDEIRPEVLASSDRARLFVVYMLDYQRIGDVAAGSRFAKLASNLSLESGTFEHLLRVNYEKIMGFLNASRYAAARRTARESIRVATRHRQYRSLCLIFFIVSAVYYEEGEYTRAIRYLDRAIRIALENGMEEQVNEYMLRYAMIYQNLGRCGDAIRCAETVVSRIAELGDIEQRFYSTLVLFEVMSFIYSPVVDIYARRLGKMWRFIRSKYRIALYHKLTADYYRSQGEHERALEQYGKSKDMYAAIGYQDDMVRVDMAVGEILIEKGDMSSAAELIKEVRRTISPMQSIDIKAEYCLLNIKYWDRTMSGRRRVDRYVERYERMRKRIGDIGVVMKVEAALCDVYARRRDATKTTKSFERYYDYVKQIAANLGRPEYMESFSRNPQLRKSIDTLMAVKKNPGQFSVN
jgi:tRNA A-37 threonylcarbamoyl transferase component Bud32/tetratricopeptide (TPR) repeat protein